MTLINVWYFCGGSPTHKKKIMFKLNKTEGSVSEITIYEGPCDVKTGEFLAQVNKTIVSGDKEITDHLEGIKLMLKEKYQVENPIFAY